MFQMFTWGWCLWSIMRDGIKLAEKVRKNSLYIVKTFIIRMFIFMIYFVRIQCKIRKEYTYNTSKTLLLVKAVVNFIVYVKSVFQNPTSINAELNGYRGYNAAVRYLKRSTAWSCQLALLQNILALTPFDSTPYVKSSCRDSANLPALHPHRRTFWVLLVVQAPIISAVTNDFLRPFKGRFKWLI